MSSLKSRLESVFTSGDRLTVLTLLRELIDSLEGLSVTPLYKHTLTGGPLGIHKAVLVSSDAAPVTETGNEFLAKVRGMMTAMPTAGNNVVYFKWDSTNIIAVDYLGNEVNFSNYTDKVEEF